MRLSGFLRQLNKGTMSKASKEPRLLSKLGSEGFGKAVSLLALILPILCLLPKICAVIPRVPYLHSHREIANTLRAIVTAHFGLDAFRVILAGESFAGVGLYQSLCALLVKLGFISGGRIISLAASAMTAIILYKVVTEWESRLAAGLAVAVLFLNPMYWDFAIAVKPEALSIFFVVFCIWQGEKYVNQGNSASFILCMIALFLGTLNHGWESCVLLPLGYLFLGQSGFRLKYVFLALIALGAVGANKLFTYISGVPALLKASFSAYSIFFYYQLFFRWDFWVSRTQTLDLSKFDSLGDVYLSGIFLTALFSSVFLFLQNRRPYDRFLSMWLLSGAAIPFVFPKGWAVHAHYGWAMIAPVSVTASILFCRVVTRFFSQKNVRTIILAACLLITCIASFGILFLDNKDVKGTTEAKRAGLAFRSALTEKHFTMKDVAIVVGEDAVKFTNPQYTFFIYSQVIPLGYDPVISPCTSSATPRVFKSLELAKKSGKRAIVLFDKDIPSTPIIIWE